MGGLSVFFWGAAERLKAGVFRGRVCTTMSCDTVEQVVLVDTADRVEQVVLVDTVDRVEQVDTVNQVNLINPVNCITREWYTPLSGNCFCQRGEYPRKTIAFFSR